MASLAYDAISIVLREHAGHLKSYEADGLKRLMVAARIIERAVTETRAAYKKIRRDNELEVHWSIEALVVENATKLMKLARHDISS